MAAAVLTVERVAAKAATIKPARVLLSIVAFPFYVLGLVVGVLWMACSWAMAAVLVGVADGKRPPPRGDE